MAQHPLADDRDLSLFACPNEDCSDFNCFAAGNLSVCERMGKNKAIRRLYCSSCGHRFSERRGTLLQDTKLPPPAVVRMVKCLGHGCSIEATADICEVDARTVERLLQRAGQRAEDFHQLQSEKLSTPQAVEMDELHGRVSPTEAKKNAGRGRQLACTCTSGHGTHLDSCRAERYDTVFACLARGTPHAANREAPGGLGSCVL